MLRELKLAVLLIAAICGGTFAYLFVHAPEQLPIDIYVKTADRVEQAQELVERVLPACRPTSALHIDIPTPPPIADYEQEAKVTVVPATISDRYANLPLVELTFGDDDRAIFRVGGIRVPPDSPNDPVLLELVLSEHGDVLEAIPTSGSKEYFAKAVAIAKHWKFKPYWRDGKPTAVRVKGHEVFLTAEYKQAPRLAPPPVKDPATLRIRLDVVPGWGGPSYSLRVRSDGTVTYHGRGEVAVLGTHCAAVSESTASAIEQEIRRTGLYAQPDSFIFDASNVVLTVEYDERVSFTTTGSADSLWRLEEFLRRILDADRWLRGNELTAKTLLAEEWDFRRNNEANRNLIDGVLLHGNIAALRDLLALGAPLHRTWNEGLFTRPRSPALEQAALRDDPQFARLVLGMKVQWDQRALNSALKSRTRIADLDTMSELIARGAQLHADEWGDTTLMTAARSGVPTVLSLILTLKPEVNKTRRDGYTALHAATGPRWSNNIESAFARRHDVIRLLLEAGADPHLKTNEGKTALDLAKQKDRQDLVSALETWIAARPPAKSPGP